MKRYNGTYYKNIEFNSLIMKLIYGILSICLLYLGISHFTHEHQSYGKDFGGRVGKHYISGKAISDLSKTELQIKNEEDVLEYVKRLNRLVHLTTYSCHPDNFEFSSIEKTVLFYLNKYGFYIDLHQGVLEIDKFKCGICHQRAYLMSTILNQNGIDAIAYGIYGHVVTAFSLDRENKYITDPDYGLGPFLYSDNNEILNETILKVYHNDDPKKLAEMYTTRKNNRPYHSPKYLNEIRDKRKFLYKISDFFAYVLMILGTLIGFLIFDIKNYKLF